MVNLDDSSGPPPQTNGRPGTWTDIAKEIPGRSGKSCRLRWCNQLDPSVKKDPFSLWEDAVIIRGWQVRAQCFAKCPFTCQFDRLSNQLCQSLDRLSDHFAKHWPPSLCMWSLQACSCSGTGGRAWQGMSCRALSPAAAVCPCSGGTARRA